MVVLSPCVSSTAGWMSTAVSQNAMMQNRHSATVAMMCNIRAGRRLGWNTSAASVWKVRSTLLISGAWGQG